MWKRDVTTRHAVREGATKTLCTSMDAHATVSSSSRPRRPRLMSSPLTRFAGAAVALVLLPLGANRASAAMREPRSVTSGESVTTTSPEWAVTLSVPRNSVRAGRSNGATLLIQNRTDHSVKVRSCRADFDYSITLGNAKVRNSPVSGAVACSITLRPGRNIFHRTLSARYEVCGGRDHPACPAPLPVGSYHTELAWPKSSAPIPAPGTLRIRVTH